MAVQAVNRSGCLFYCSCGDPMVGRKRYKILRWFDVLTREVLMIMNV